MLALLLKQYQSHVAGSFRDLRRLTLGTPDLATVLLPSCSYHAAYQNDRHGLRASHSVLRYLNYRRFAEDHASIAHWAAPRHGLDDPHTHIHCAYTLHAITLRQVLLPGSALQAPTDFWSACIQW